MPPLERGKPADLRTPEPSAGRPRVACLGRLGQGDAGPDPELVEDMPQVSVDSVGGYEERLADLAVGLTVRGELGDGYFSARESLPASLRTLRSDTPSA